MLPESLLRYHVASGRVVPDYLGPEDEPWLRALVETCRAMAGARRLELEARLATPVPGRPEGRFRMALHVLERLVRTRWDAAVSPRRARSVLFGAAAAASLRLRLERPTVLAEAAESLGLEPAVLEQALFADLPSERVVGEAPGDLSPRELALRTNQALVQGLLFRAAAVRIDAEGNARALVRHARLRGLISTVVDRGGRRGARLEVSGPFSLFRRTLVYGRALGELVGCLTWCDRFRLEADCVLHGFDRRLHVATGDPIFPSAEPRRYDSRVERLFARDFIRSAPDWELVREPEPVRAGASLVFPDFALVHRRDPARRWLLEIVGFWTADYLAKKLARLREAGIARLLLAVDEERNCAEAELPAGARVLRYRGRLEAQKVLEAIEGLP